MSSRLRKMMMLLGGAILVFAATYPVRRGMWRSASQLKVQREAMERSQSVRSQVEDFRVELTEILGRLAADPGRKSDLLRASSICGQLRMYPDALFYAEEAAAAAPREAEPLRAQGDVHFTQGRYDLAMEAYRAALQRDAVDFESGARLAYLYIKLGWSTNTRKILRDLEARGLQPARVALLHALFAHQNADFAMALRKLASARKSQEGQPEIHALFAAIYKDQASQDKALAEIEQAIALKPDEAKYRVFRAQILVAMPKPDVIQPALEEFRKALELSPRSTDALYGLAQCYKRLNNDDASLSYYRQVQEIAPEHAGVLSELAQLLARRGERGESQSMLQRYRNALKYESYLKGAHIRVAMQPENFQGHFTLGRLHLKVGDFPRGIVELKRALELRPGDGEVRRILADALAIAGRYEESRALAPPRPLAEAREEIAAFRPA